MTLLQIFQTAAVSCVLSLASFLALLPTKVGERLLAGHFEEKIARLKHEQTTALGHLQAELDHMKDRGVRSNEREYQAVYGVWESFVDAFQATKRCVMNFKSFPNLADLSEAEVREFLQDEEIIGRDATFIVSAKDRNSAYGRAERIRTIYRAGDACLGAKAMLDKQCVFIPKLLSDHFDQCIEFVNQARVEQYMTSRTDLEQTAIDKSIALVSGEGAIMFEELRNAVRERLLHALGKPVGTNAEPNGL